MLYLSRIARTFFSFHFLSCSSNLISDASPSQPHTSPIRSKIKALMNLALAGMMPSGCQDKKKRKGLVIKATNTTVSRIIVIHEFYYVFLSVSDLSQYVSTWPSKITARLRWEIRPCVLCRSHVSRLFPRKKN